MEHINSVQGQQIAPFNMIHSVVLYQYIITQVRQLIQQYLEISMLVNIYGYMFRLILSYAIFRPIGYRIQVCKMRT
jgi:hypothetical protein